MGNWTVKGSVTVFLIFFKNYSLIFFNILNI